ncbi:MAG: acyl carrier protein, partial [Rhodocyclaceae bacterium]
ATTAVAGAQPAPVAAVTAQTDWRGRFAAAAPAERPDLMRELVRRQVMATLRLDEAQAPALHDRLMDLGMDSLMAVQLRNGLGKALGLPRALPSTLMFDHPTIEAIAAFLLEKIAAPASSAPAAAPTAATSAPLAAADVAGLSDDDIARLLDERLGMK